MKIEICPECFDRLVEEMKKYVESPMKDRGGLKSILVDPGYRTTDPLYRDDDVAFGAVDICEPASLTLEIDGIFGIGFVRGGEC